MSGLGRSLVKSHKRKQRFVAKDGHRHSTELPDGRDWGRLNLHSVTEQTSLDDFLDKVQLADKEYNSEFFNIKIVSQDTANGVLTESEKLAVSTAQEKHKNLLCIPRRPQWDQDTSKEQLDRNENESFLEWRRNLCLLNEEEHINLTPYEKNLEVWRQLWRVIERSDVVVQIIDSRNPLLFRCEDLEIYVKETDEKKLNVLLLNKADFLTLKQREMWAHYFSSIGVKVAFFSALQQMQKDEEASEESESDELSDSELKTVTKAQDLATEESLMEMKKLSCSVEQSLNQYTSVCNDPKLLSKEELITFLKKMGQEVQKKSVATVGLVGYPNVGKSSTINAVLSSKKVSVSATPGKTKHFQTIMVDPELCFCDCPGLVFPNFVSTKAAMVINGILPIDQLTSHIPPVTLVANAIPREALESTYSIKLPTPSEGQDPSRPPTAEEFLGAHGYMRGFMTQRGLPDTARSARYILKDFVNGKLLYCHAPPDVKQEEYQEFFSLKHLAKTNAPVQSVFHGAESIDAGNDFDQTFFKMLHEKNKKSKEVESPSGFPGAHVKNLDHAKRMLNGQVVSNNAKNTKKEYKLHHNKNRKEKSRRVHAHLDQ